MSVSVRWEIIQVRLEEPLRLISIPQATAGAYLVFWWRDIPLGHARIEAAAFPLHRPDFLPRISRAIAPAVANYSCLNGSQPEQPCLWQNAAGASQPVLQSLACLNRPLENLTKLIPPAHPEKSTSVIVCTRNRPDQLKRCLSALQELEPAPTEIIVVDNEPQESGTLAVVREFAGVTYLSEPIPGLSRARNRGILGSSSEIVAFTDDDVVVHRRWLAAVQEAFSSEAIDAMTGLVLAGALETESQVNFEFEFDGLNRGYLPITFDPAFFKSTAEQGVPVWRIGAGANMAFRREVFDRIGLFDEQLGAGASGCSEDSELWYRMLARGMSIAYEPRAAVWHAHRSGASTFRSQMKEYMRGHVTALLVQYERHQHFGNLRRLLFSLPLYYLRRVKKTFRKGDTRLLWSEILGFVSGFFTYLREALPRFSRRPFFSRISPAPDKSMVRKRSLGDFLGRNPYPSPYTEGLFYREKMRAIHRIAPAQQVDRILEVGGGRSGLAHLLYPAAQIVNIDLNEAYATAPCNQHPAVRFVCGEATNLPFENETFDLVTMFDLLEHVPDDRKAAQEAFRVLRPGGFLLVSTPNENWSFPYYSFMRNFCPPESELFAAWGHVRRGYSARELEAVLGWPAKKTVSFINPMTVLCHDFGFSKLPMRVKRLCWMILSPITFAGYALDRGNGRGTETAYLWIKPSHGG